jgi:putative protease
VLGQGYVLSPKDLCTLPFLEKLVEAGVNALKIEGRMRSPEYVHTVVSAYRKALDYYASNRGRRGWRKGFEALKKTLQPGLEAVYNRGFSSGFYLGKPLGQWAQAGGSVATKRKYHVARVMNYYRKPSVAELLVSGEGFSVGDLLQVEGVTTGYFQHEVSALLQEGQPLSRAEAGMRVTLQLGRPVRRGDKLYLLK